MRQLLPFVTGMLTIYAMWLAGSKKWQGWLVGLINQGLWCATIIVFNTWGLLPLTIFLTVTYARNLIRWRREGNEGDDGHTQGERTVERRASRIIEPIPGGRSISPVYRAERSRS